MKNASALPKQFKQVKAAAQEVCKFDKKKCRAEEFANELYASGELPYCKVCQLVNWKHVDA